MSQDAVLREIKAVDSGEKLLYNLISVNSTQIGRASCRERV